MPNETFGKRKLTSMVFLGKSGEGKTTLLTALIDHIEGKSFEERSKTKRVFHAARGVSQT